ncbi:MAG: hypothetical protein M1832_002164 [Thelocarpon impressellum]|nr:MAG: hypothetical protein M1832_002164 [Thelocarpon impressellum]
MAAARHELAKHPEARMLPPRPNPAGELPSWIPKRDESLRGASAQQEPMAERTQPGRSTGRPLELFGSAAFDRRLAFRGAEHRAPSPDKRHSGVPTEQEKQVGLFEASDIADDDDDESIAPEPESQPRPDPGQPKGTTTTAKAAPTIALDYPPSTLSKMSYATLLAEPFDQPPSISSPVAPSVLPSTHVSAPLDHQLAYVSSLPPDQQRQFFASLSTPQWEDAGDWFAAQFAAHVARKRDARRRKRKVAETFEEELRAREALVRRRREGVEEVLAGMKRGGDAVLKSGGGGGNSAS